MGQESTSINAERFENLLVVDDNPGDRRLIKEAFADTPFDPTIHTATTGEDALSFLQQRDEYSDAPLPDAVFLDVSLPDMSGREVLEYLSGDLPETPVILMSGSEPLTKQSSVREEGVDRITTKPDDPEEYLALLQSL